MFYNALLPELAPSSHIGRVSGWGWGLGYIGGLVSRDMYFTLHHLAPDFTNFPGYVARANDDMLKRKVGAAVVAVRRAGAMHAFDSINHFFLIGQMIIPGSSYWNIGIGRAKGEVEQDEEALRTMQTLGQDLAWLLKKTRT